MAGKHGAKRRKGEEEQAYAALYQQPDAQAGQGGSPAFLSHQGQLNGQGDARHHQVGQQGKGQSRQILGAEQGLPAQRQGMHHAGGAVVVEVTEHRHGAQHPVAAGHKHPKLQGIGDVSGILYQAVGQLHRGHGGTSHREVVVQQVEGEQKQPHQAVGCPQRPEPQHGLAVEGRIKERCPGPHSPHLPTHK